MKKDIDQQIEHLKPFISPQRWDRFMEIIQHRTRHVAMVLEDIFQPHNASAVLRSCDCFGIQDVHIIEQENEYVLSKEVSLGSNKWLNMVRYNQKGRNNTAYCYERLKEKGYHIVATSPHAKLLIEDISIEKPTAFVMGGELRGLSEYAINHADQLVKIPMYGFTESYNISVSAAILLYDRIQKIKHAGIPFTVSEIEQKHIILGWLKSSIKNGDLIHEKFLNETDRN